MFLPERDKFSHTKRFLESQLSSLFGGRIAEELIFGFECVTTGASNDIQRATEIARNMVTKWGLSEKLGPMVYGDNQDEVFLGYSMNKRKDLSDTTTRIIDEEIRNFIDRNYQRAKDILITHMEKLHMMADALIKYETIEKKQIEQIMSGQQPSPPDGWNDSPSSGNSSSGGTTIAKVDESLSTKPDQDGPMDHPVNP